MRYATFPILCLIGSCCMSPVWGEVGGDLVARTGGSAFSVVDLALSSGEGAGGVLSGVLFRHDGSSLAGQLVRLVDSRDASFEVVSDREGRFQFHGLRGGIYVCQSHGAVKILRLWSPGTAPPGAATAVFLTAGDCVRGQAFDDPFLGSGVDQPAPPSDATYPEASHLGDPYYFEAVGGQGDRITSQGGDCIPCGASQADSALAGPEFGPKNFGPCDCCPPDFSGSCRRRTPLGLLTVGVLGGAIIYGAIDQDDAS